LALATQKMRFCAYKAFGGFREIQTDKLDILPAAGEISEPMELLPKSLFSFLLSLRPLYQAG
jgi:hypothetical protein